jgi:acetyl esterase/lipase
MNSPALLVVTFLLAFSFFQSASISAQINRPASTGISVISNTPAQPKPVPPKEVAIWNGPAPYSHGSAQTDIPSLILYPAPKSDLRSGAAIIVCPGGAYRVLSMEYEGTNVAQWFQAHGVSAFVLRYRLPVNGYGPPVPLLDAQRAIRLVRSHAASMGVDITKVGMIGFSAGGHLSSLAETHFDNGNPRSPDPVERFSSRPDFAILVYPLITLKQPVTNMECRTNLLGANPDPALIESLSTETQVRPDTPPTYLIAARDDGLVSPENSRIFYAALQAHKVDSLLKILPGGGHGFGFSYDQTGPAAGWLDGVGAWMMTHHWFQE